MQFRRRSKTFELAGQEVTIYELSAAEMQYLQEVEDQNLQVLRMVHVSLDTKPAEPEDMMDWPNSVLNTLVAEVMELNGLTDDSGN